MRSHVGTDLHVKAQNSNRTFEAVVSLPLVYDGKKDLHVYKYYRMENRETNRTVKQT